MHMAGIITLYSNSPPAAVWSSLSSLSSYSASHFDANGNFRHAYNHNSAARPVVSGKPSSQSPTSFSEWLDCSFARTLGSVPNSSLGDLSHNAGTWEGTHSRSGSVSDANEHLYQLRTRYKVSVLHGPVPWSSHKISSMHSLFYWNGAVSAPRSDRHSRRRDVFSTDDHRPMLRGAKFAVGSDGHGSMVAYQSPSLSAESSAICSESSEPSEAQLSKINAEPKEPREVRRRLTRATGESSSLKTSNSPPSAGELLRDAQERNKIFFDALVVKAFEIAEEAHRGQVRRSGGLYLAHCLETAILLANAGADSRVVAAGLLHDTFDDSTLDQTQLRALVGNEIVRLVSGVSKLSTLSQLARDNETAWNSNPEEADRLKTMFLAMVDVRAILIKLADRLHNLRTLEALPVAKQQRIANETMEILAPLANRLGIWRWKAEMEDICFRHLKPQEYGELASKMTEGWQEGVVLSSIHQLRWALRKEGVKFVDICGRTKNLYSIYSKVIRKGGNINEIFDVRGLRLIVKDTESCYAALGVVHRLWSHSPEKFKDYIRNPKANGYQSLHTVAWGKDGRPLEVQIRTIDMHHEAEWGMAAHWMYKENNSKHSSLVLQKVQWARWVLTSHCEILDTKLRVAPLEADLRPPCRRLFPFHKDDCPHADVSSLPPQRDEDPLLVIMVRDQNMIVQELAPGSTVADILMNSSSDRDSKFASEKRTSGKIRRLKVNHEFVENFQQKLRMGDLVELTLEPEPTPVMGPRTSKAKLELTQAQKASLLPANKPCGTIAWKFQREQRKRLYLTGRYNGGLPTPEEEEACVFSESHRWLPNSPSTV